MSSFTLLLAGITVNSIAIAAILLLQNFATFGQSFAIVRWLMGGVESIEYPKIAALAASVIAVAIFAWRRARDWNLLAVGEEWAAARGVATGRALLAGFLAGSFVTAMVTSLTGLSASSA